MAVDMATGEVTDDGVTGVEISGAGRVVRMTMDELERATTGELPGLPRPSWQELGFAFARVENAQAQVDDLASDLKEAKEELKQAQQALYAMGKRVRR